MPKEKKKLTQTDIMSMLDKIYATCMNGIPHVSPSIEEFAEDYLKKADTPEKACKSMINTQVVKCTTSGFVTGFGGFITMPVTLPANITSVLYVQMRMIACAAYIAGFDIDSDQTQTFVYACLAGVSLGKVIKQAGIKFGVKLAKTMVGKIPGKVLVKINQKVGFRFLTKFGTKGIINIGKAVPFVGAVIGGGLDLAETKIIGNRAYKWFVEHDFNTEKDEPEEEIIELSEDDIKKVDEVESEEE